jgi:hypothetical protein
MGPAATWAQAKPCTLPSLGVQGGTSATTPCPSGTAPTWFANQTERTWVQIAGGSGMTQAWQVGHRIADVAPSPLPPGADGINAIHNNWTGGCANQSLGEYYLPAQGGHNGYYGNEVYALALRSETPTWQRIWGPTPNSQILTNDPGYNPPATSHADGNPRPVHGWYNPQCSGDGRIWLIGAPAYGNPGGQWGTSVYSIDRNNLSAGWMYHGRLWPTIPGGAPGSSFGFQSGPCAYDRAGNIMYAAGDFAVSNGVAQFNAATAVAAGAQSQSTGPAVPGSSQINTGDFTGLENAWSVILHNFPARYWVVGCTGSSQLWILDPTNVAAGFKKVSTSGTGSWNSGCNALYIAAYNAIYVGGVETGATVRKLVVPANPLTGTWTWTTLTNNSGSATPAGGYQYNGTFSKLQVIEDMGNGQAALVLMSDVASGTYVYKLPVGG